MTARKTAVLHRMVMDKHVCPYGLKSKYLLESQGYAVEDHWLTTREETDAFKAKHGVKTTPQTFIDGVRIGGNDDLRRYFGKKVKDADALNAAEPSLFPTFTLPSSTAMTKYGHSSPYVLHG